MDSIGSVRLIYRTAAYVAPDISLMSEGVSDAQVSPFDALGSWVRSDETDRLLAQ